MSGSPTDPARPETAAAAVGLSDALLLLHLVTWPQGDSALHPMILPQDDLDGLEVRHTRDVEVGNRYHLENLDRSRCGEVGTVD